MREGSASFLNRLFFRRDPSNWLRPCGLKVTPWQMISPNQRGLRQLIAKVMDLRETYWGVVRR